MLSRSLLARQQLRRLTCVTKHARCSSQVATEPDLTGWTETRLSAPKPKKPTREPFAKNLFLGQFDVAFLAYPEPQTHERHRDFFEWLKPIEDYIGTVDAREIDRSSRIPDEVFDELRRLGVLRAVVDEAYGGLGLNSSEYAKLVETVSAVPVLGTFLVKRAAVVNLIRKFANDRQKSDLLTKIATDELRPAVCFSESPSGTTSEPLDGRAVFSDCRTFFTLNTVKTCVVDAGNANLFVVLAQTTVGDAFAEMHQHLGAFVVSRDDEGVTIGEPMPMLGQHGLKLCTVNFKDVKVPAENVLGKGNQEVELFMSAMGEGRHNVGAQAIGILKRFLNLLTTNLRQGKNFNSQKYQDDSLHETVGKIASSLYAMEAVTYLTTGMMDNFENQDNVVEQSLVESHCATTCVENILQGIQILGARGCYREEPYEQVLRDALALNVSDRAAIDTKIFAALMGVQHAGQAMGTKVKHTRNPLFHPVEMMRNVFSLSSNPKLYIDENLHPTLRTSADSLEQSVHTLQECVKKMLIQNGILLMSHRMELRRLAEMLIEIYAMTAVVARASRSYCIGMRNAEHEIEVAMIFTYHTFQKVNAIERDLAEGDWSNGDLLLKSVAESIFQKKSYFAEHPLERTY